VTDPLQHEPFLRAIFDAPDDDTPRLVYADWLEENGEVERAAFIRLQCELYRVNLEPAEDKVIFRRRLELEEAIVNLLRAGLDENRTFASAGFAPKRGFLTSTTARIPVELLADADALRRHAVTDHPEWYGATTVKIIGGPVSTLAPFETLFDLPFTSRMTALDISGNNLINLEPQMGPDGDIDFEMELDLGGLYTVVTPLGVEALASCRGCRRLTSLDLRNNDLDNDAAQYIARSANFIRLEHLYILEGNHLRGRTWSRLLERFGEDVVQ
jgi:uncharacterized protein (TIGR02996 family)